MGWKKTSESDFSEEHNKGQDKKRYVRMCKREAHTHPPSLEGDSAQEHMSRRARESSILDMFRTCLDKARDNLI